MLNTRLMTTLLLGLSSLPALAAEPVKAELTFAALHAKQTTALKLESSAFKDGGLIPLQNSSYGASLSPALSWSAGPTGTKSYALLLEDENGVRDGKSIVHWVLYNIPANVTALFDNLPKDGQLSTPAGARQGITISGATGYLGPKPRPATGTHHYHFQIYALDQSLDLAAGATREQWTQAIADHVLAKGKLVGIYEAPKE